MKILSCLVMGPRRHQSMIGLKISSSHPKKQLSTFQDAKWRRTHHTRIFAIDLVRRRQWARHLLWILPRSKWPSEWYSREARYNAISCCLENQGGVWRTCNRSAISKSSLTLLSDHIFILQSSPSSSNAASWIADHLKKALCPTKGATSPFAHPIEIHLLIRRVKWEIPFSK